MCTLGGMACRTNYAKPCYKKGHGLGQDTRQIDQTSSRTTESSIDQSLQPMCRQQRISIRRKIGRGGACSQKNDNLNIMNYRPVSILSSMSKVLEKLILRQMTRFLSKILDPMIAAYRQGYSCQDVILRLVEDWKRALENRKHVGAVLMDLSKAFDCLPHQQLLVAKLRAYGACDRSCALIWSYLSGRRQRVRIGCSTSEWLPLTKGSPRAPSWHQYCSISSSTTYMQPSQSRPSTTMPTIIPYLHAAIPSN